MPDIANEPAQDSCATEAVVTPETADDAQVLTNYRVEFVKTTVRGETRDVAIKFALSITQIASHLTQTVKFSCDARGLFHYDFVEGKALYVDTDDSMFALLRGKFGMTVRWINSGADSEADNYVTRKEFHQYLKQSVRRVSRISTTPTFPPVDDLFYVFGELPPPDPTCATFERFINALAPSSPSYRTLIKAMFFSPVLSRPGKPIFAILARSRQRSGKSALAAFVGILFGGLIDVNAKGLSSGMTEHALLQQLVTADALTKIVVRFDNVIGRFVSTFLATVVTGESISCRPAYGRDQVNRSTGSLCILLTSNTVAFDSDLKRRVVTIHIDPPVAYERLWAETWAQYLVENKKQIYSDLLHRLEHAGERINVPVNRLSIGDWEATALAAACDSQAEFEAAIQTILHDQGLSDAEQAEYEDLAEYLDKQVALLEGYDPAQPIFIDRGTLKSWLPADDVWDILPPRRTHQSIGLLFKHGIRGWSRDLDRWPTDYFPSHPRGYVHLPSGTSVLKAGETYQLQFIREQIVEARAGNDKDHSHIDRAKFSPGKDYQ